MPFQIYIKRFFLTAIGIFLLSSCSLVGGKNEVDTTENSVLSGPPLAIPPEFDIDSQNANQQQPMQTYDLETLDGSDDISNLGALCWLCNSKKSNKSLISAPIPPPPKKSNDIRPKKR